MNKLSHIILALVLFPCTAMAIPQAMVVENVQVPCWEAINSTYAHYSIGDGSGLGCAVEYLGGDIENEIPPAGGISCLRGQFDRTTCFMYGEYCPDPTPPGNPHTYPGVAECTGCGPSPSSPPGKYSINEAKCCLLTGSPVSVLCPN